MIYERSGKMDPLSVNNQNHSFRTISDSSTINLIAIDDTLDSMSTSNTVPILEQNVTQPKFLLSKIAEVIGKNMSYVIATSGNIVAQMIISTTVAKTPWNIENIIHSLEFSGGIIAIDTLGEPHIFSSIENIKTWVWNKWKNNDNTVNLKKELIVVTTFLLGLSYSAVLLDRASNHLLDDYFSIAIVQQQTGVEFLSYVLNMTFHGAIISTFEKGIKLSWKKIKNLFNQNNNSNINLEAQLINTEQDNSLQLEVVNNFFYQNLLPLFLIAPISITITWATENCISNQEFSFNKWLTDMPKVTAGVMLSLVSSLLNCMVNGQEIPFLPRMSTIKSWFGYQKNYITKDVAITNPEFANNQTTIENFHLFSEDLSSYIISDSQPSFDSSTDSSLASSDQFCSWSDQGIETDKYDFEKLQLRFKADDDSEQYFDAVEHQEVEFEALFDSQSVNSYGTFSSDSEDKNSSDSGISSEGILTNKLQLITI